MAFAALIEIRIEALIDVSEIERRKDLLQLYRNGEVHEPIEYTSYSMKRRR